MRTPLVLFVLATAYLHYTGEPFDQRPGARVIASEAATQRLRPPARSRLEPVQFAGEKSFAAGLERSSYAQPKPYRRELSEVRKAYRYALTAAEQRATHGLLSQVLDAVRPAPDPRLAAGANQITSSAYLRRADARIGFTPSYASTRSQRETARVRIASRDMAGYSGSFVANRLTASGPDSGLVALAGQSLDDSLTQVATVEDAVAETDSEAAAEAAKAAELQRRAAARDARRRVQKERAARVAAKKAARSRRAQKALTVGSRPSSSKSYASSSRRKAFGFHVVGGSISFNSF